MDYMKYLTKEEMQTIWRENAAHKWGYDKSAVEGFIEKHRSGTDKDKAEVICRLEDVNYHTLCNALDEGDYAGALALVEKEWN